tara:strand:- start:3103 stop:3474 length:372 start_codon:yes stop_codon:yes gene_type:complete
VVVVVLIYLSLRRMCYQLTIATNVESGLTRAGRRDHPESNGMIKEEAMSNKLTLKEQLTIRNMSEDELKEALAPTKGWAGFNLSLFIYAPFIWRIIHWCWFNGYTGERGFWLFARHGFKEWRE